MDENESDIHCLFEVINLEGKFKFNQNRTIEDRLGVIQALEDRSNHSDKEVASLMKGYCPIL
jgi:predicted FMN-binding regulatory protein PaiB